MEQLKKEVNFRLKLKDSKEMIREVKEEEEKRDADLKLNRSSQV